MIFQNFLSLVCSIKNPFFSFMHEFDDRNVALSNYTNMQQNTIGICESCIMIHPSLFAVAVKNAKIGSFLKLVFVINDFFLSLTS